MYIYPTLAATALLFSSTYAFKAQCIGNAVNGDNLAAAKQNLIDWCKAGNTVGTWRWFAVNDVMAYVCNSVVHGDDPGCKEEDINSAFSAITSSCGYGEYLSLGCKDVARCCDADFDL